MEDSFYQDKDGFWKINDEERVGLDNTIVHEMMHAFMDDYNRPGMVNGIYNDSEEVVEFHEHDVRYPRWFKEGIASCVDVLRYMDYYSQDGKTVNGSVLTSFDSTQGSLLKDEKTEGKAYVIQDNNTGNAPNYVKSTVDPYMAYLSSGVGLEDEDTESEDTTAIAAKEENEVIEYEEPVEIIEQQEEVLPAA